jgi:hypothetical protein
LPSDSLSQRTIEPPRHKQTRTPNIGCEFGDIKKGRLWAAPSPAFDVAQITEAA